MKTKGHFAMAASRIKTSLLENTPGEIPNHIETSQSTRLANQLSGLHTIQASTKDICKQTIMGHR